jgi:hypothetical protein
MSQDFEIDSLVSRNYSETSTGRCRRLAVPVRKECLLSLLLLRCLAKGMTIERLAVQRWLVLLDSAERQHKRVDKYREAGSDETMASALMRLARSADQLVKQMLNLSRWQTISASAKKSRMPLEMTVQPI